MDEVAVEIDLTVLPDEQEEIDDAESTSVTNFSVRKGIEVVSSLDELAHADAKSNKKKHATKRAKSGSGTGLK